MCPRMDLDVHLDLTQKEEIVLLKNNGQADKETIEDIMKRKKAKERERRIREFNNNDEFELDEETETVIKMTNRNKKSSSNLTSDF